MSHPKDDLEDARSRNPTNISVVVEKTTVVLVKLYEVAYEQIVSHFKELERSEKNT